MRLLLYTPFLILFFYSNLFAQTPTETTHLSQSAVSASGSRNYEKLRITNMYRFPAFTDAEVFLQNGDTATGLFNYNISADQMHYLGQKNDTLYVTDPLAIKFIQLEECRFYYFKDAYLQTLFITDEIILAFRQSFIILSMWPWHNTENKLFHYYTSKGEKHNLLDDKWPLRSQEYYYFGDKFGNFFRADKKFIYDHYPKYQEQIRSFIKTNQIYFDNPESIISLLKYCTTLNG